MVKKQCCVVNEGIIMGHHGIDKFLSFCVICLQNDGKIANRVCKFYMNNSQNWAGQLLLSSLAVTY